MTLAWNICGLRVGWLWAFTYGLKHNNQENDKIRYTVGGRG
jgi:hypothetical protein